MAHIPKLAIGEIPLGSSRNLNENAGRQKKGSPLIMLGRNQTGNITHTHIPLSARVSSSTTRPNQAQYLPGSVVIQTVKQPPRIQSVQRVNPHMQYNQGNHINITNINRIYKSPVKTSGGEKPYSESIGQKIKNMNENSSVRTKVNMQKNY